MKAAAIREHGSIEQLEIMDLQKPEIGPHDVLVKVQAFALNRLDIWTRQGLPDLDLDFPHIGGSDFSGDIIKIGDKVKNIDEGTRVAVNPGIYCGTCSSCERGEQSLCDDFHILGEHIWGGAAEYVKVPSRNVIEIPDHVSYEEAAATSLTGLTSYRMLKTKAQVKPGDTVLIIGSGGGIGTMSLQIARELGGKIIAITSSNEKIDWAKEQGAEYVIDYSEEENWSKKVWQYTNKKGVDVAIDSTGQKVFKQAIRSLSKGGKYVSCGATSGRQGELNLALLFWKQLSVLGSTMASQSEFEEMIQLLFDERIEPVIDTKYKLEEIKEAHERQVDPSHMGKILITLD